MLKAKKIAYYGFILSTLFAAWCSQQAETPSIQTASTSQTANTTMSFKAEYEALNDADHPNMIVPENLNIQTLNFEQTQAMISSGTGILFFGFPSCPWCRNLLPELFVAMQKAGVNDLYYYNPKAIRDEKILLSWTIVTKKETNAEYQWILDKLDSILPAYEGLNDPSIKRLYVPTVLILKEGKILNHHFNTLDEQTDPHTPLTSEQKLQLQTILQDKITPLSNEVCGIPEEWSTEKYSC